MKSIHSVMVIGLTLLEFLGSSHSSCYNGGYKKLKYKKLSARCSATEGIRECECQKAIDGNLNSMWTPNNKIGDEITLFYTIILKEPVWVTAVEISQNLWPHGRASKMSFDFGNDNLFSKYFNRDEVDQFYPDYPIETAQITIFIDGIDGILFGGFREIILRGCRIREYQQQTYTEFPNPESPNPDSDYSPAKLGSIIGASVGLIIAIILFAVLIFIYCSSKKKGEKADEMQPDADNNEKADSSSSSSSSSSSGSTEKLNEENNPDEIEKTDS